MDVFQDRNKKHKFRSRLVAIMGVLPGVWFLLVTQTEFGDQMTIQCGYWFIMLFVMSFVWLFYAVFVRMMIVDASQTIIHAHSLNERHAAQIARFSIFFESAIAIVIFVLSVTGFLLTDLQCVLSRVM